MGFFSNLAKGKNKVTNEVVNVNNPNGLVYEQGPVQLVSREPINQNQVSQVQQSIAVEQVNSVVSNDSVVQQPMQQVNPIPQVEPVQSVQPVQPMINQMPVQDVEQSVSVPTTNEVVTPNVNGFPAMINTDPSNVLEQMQNRAVEEAAAEEQNAEVSNPMDIFNQNISLDGDNPMSIFGADSQDSNNSNQ